MEDYFESGERVFLSKNFQRMTEDIQNYIEKKIILYNLFNIVFFSFVSMLIISAVFLNLWIKIISVLLLLVIIYFYVRVSRKIKKEINDINNIKTLIENKKLLYTRKLKEYEISNFEKFSQDIKNLLKMTGGFYNEREDKKTD
ncbi:MAG: hypothetical protein H7A30_05715 [Thermotogae bacterium]|nr:hypothetical protein [Thermotogota bacterium]